MADDPLAGLTRRQLEDIRDRVEKQLRSCVIDDREGARPYRITGGHGNAQVASIMLCKPCFERFRLPEGRARIQDTENPR